MTGLIYCRERMTGIWQYNFYPGLMMKRRFLQICLLGLAAVVMAAGCALPFLYESQTLWYKTGWDKVLLRAGHVFGILAFFSLLLQILLGSRGRVLEESFGIAAVMRWHRGNGLLLPLLACVHVLLVLLPEGLANLPIGAEFWPEALGGALFVTIAFQVGASSLRQRLHLNYSRWRFSHRLLAYLALLLAAVHVLFVADNFAQGVPRIALLVTVGLVAGRIVFRRGVAGNEK